MLVNFLVPATPAPARGLPRQFSFAAHPHRKPQLPPRLPDMLSLHHFDEAPYDRATSGRLLANFLRRWMKKSHPPPSTLIQPQGNFLPPLLSLPKTRAYVQD